MKKKILLLTIALFVGAISGCGNRQIIDTTKTFQKAILALPNGEIIEGEVDSWRDYEDSDQIQVEIEDVTYLVHSSNVVLIHE